MRSSWKEKEGRKEHSGLPEVARRSCGCSTQPWKCPAWSSLGWGNWNILNGPPSPNQWEILGFINPVDWVWSGRVGVSSGTKHQTCFIDRVGFDFDRIWVFSEKKYQCKICEIWEERAKFGDILEGRTMCCPSLPVFQSLPPARCLRAHWCPQKSKARDSH